MKFFISCFLLLATFQVGQSQELPSARRERIKATVLQHFQAHEKEFIGGNTKRVKTGKLITAIRVKNLTRILSRIDDKLLEGEFGNFFESSLVQRYGNLDYGWDYALALELEQKYILNQANKVLPTLTPKRAAEILNAKARFPQDSHEFNQKMLTHLLNELSKFDSIEIELNDRHSVALRKLLAFLVEGKVTDNAATKYYFEGINAQIFQLMIVKTNQEKAENYAGMMGDASQNLFSLSYIPNIGIENARSFEQVKGDVNAVLKQLTVDGNRLHILHSELDKLMKFAYDSGRFPATEPLRPILKSRQKNVIISIVPNKKLWVIQ